MSNVSNNKLTKNFLETKLTKRKKELEQKHKENLQKLQDFDKNKDDIEYKTYFGSDNYKKLKMARYVYDNNSLHKNNKQVKKRQICLYFKRIILIFIAAMIFNFGVLAFLNRGDTIPSGLSGFPMLAILIAKSRGVQLDPYFALLYVGINIPLLLGFGFKVKRSFILLTVAFMSFQIISNIIYTIPEVKNFILQYTNIASGWYKNIVINFKNEDGSTTSIFLENSTGWPILINGVLGSICVGIPVAIAWKNGGSTGGTDIIAYYFSTKKQKNVAAVMLMVSLCSTSLFLLVFGIAAPHSEAIDLSLVRQDYLTINSEETKMTGKLVLDATNNITQQQFTERYISPRTVFGLREFSTILYIIINNVLLGILYPKYKKVTLEISCKNPEDILQYLKDIKYWHSYTIYTARSGYLDSDIKIISTTLLYLESKDLIDDIKLIDPKAWVAIKPVEEVKGSFNTSFVEN
ncbi:YitT family protein [Mycoplasma tauri]|uniref:YitT family protein n=1 Tax=Mycoplasma tauri TaxID=547987 RepID=A0A953NC42_9MOLU|nr:YitT family protein [Mycoplasma tauri]MBZ4195132.1 YitT family protein [Mycoplasma tauri]MBZ4203671.1 YitT family protein [Mycoplasma tauri]MBZ4212407.1 YitT family protein [Mycoplasma tauri]MBZ4218165.1 YitT family protein [Mycoplasma tauri]